MQLQHSSVAMDSRHSGGHHSCWSISSGHVEMYHLLEGLLRIQRLPEDATITEMGAETKPTLPTSKVKLY